MAFNNYSITQNEGRKSDIDYDALNKYVVETCGLETPEVLIGVVAGIVDLGIQEQEDAEVTFTGSEEDEVKEIEKNSNTYFKNGTDQQTKKPVRLKCWPQKAVQSVAIAVEFPDILLDKGQFFGNTSGEAKPLRMWLGGEFFNSTQRAKLIARPTPLKIGKDTKGRWSFNSKSIFFKMAVASKLIQPDGVFLPQDIDKLVGKAFQFEAQIYLKEGKDKKQYFTEKVAFKSGLGRGQEAPELPTETFVVQFNSENDEKALKELRYHVINTIKNAKNYEGSPIQKQLEAAKGYSKPVGDDEDDVPEPSPVVKAVKTRSKPTVVADEDDGSPF